MNRNARTCFLAMMVAETLIVGLLFLAAWHKLVDAGWDSRVLGSRPLAPPAGFEFVGPGFSWGVLLGTSLLWIALLAFPKEGWPHGTSVRIGLLVGLLPAIPVFGAFALEGRGSPIVSDHSLLASLSWLTLVAWVLVHPAVLAWESWFRERKVSSMGWACVALAPCLATLLAPATLWVAGLVLLAVRLGLGIATPFAWRSTVRVWAVPQRAPVTALGHRARTCLLAMVIAETAVLSVVSLGPWMEGIETERTLARLVQRSFTPNVIFGFVERFGFDAMVSAIALLWVAIAVFPKDAWPYGRRMRMGLIAGLLPALAVLGAKRFVHVEDVSGALLALGNAAAVISLPILFLWLMVHPLQLARESKRRGQTILSSAWTTVGLATSLSLFFLILTPDFGTSLVLSGALAFLAVRLALGAATALAWRRSPSLGGAS